MKHCTMLRIRSTGTEEACRAVSPGWQPSTQLFPESMIHSDFNRLHEP